MVAASKLSRKEITSSTKAVSFSVILGWRERGSANRLTMTARASWARKASHTCWILSASWGISREEMSGDDMERNVHTLTAKSVRMSK